MFGHDDSQTQNTQNDQTSYQSAIPEPASILATASDLVATSAPVTSPLPEPQTVEPTSAPTTVSLDGPIGSGEDLITIKQEALQHLMPLVGHLEQTPEEKFRTTMMLIQASDNQELVKEAYEAARQISDEKARAQALLDVVNEINYFTQQHNG